MYKTKYLVVLVAILSVISLQGQERKWKEQISKDGKVAVKSEIVKGDNGKMIYYVAKTTTDLTMEQVASYLKNPTNYTNFLQYTKKCEKVESLTENEWVTHMFVDAPWPMANFDCVQKYTFEETENGFKLKGVADPNAYDMGDVKRMEVYTIEYAFEKGSRDINTLVLTANYKPTASAPNWLLKRWFPNGPAKLLSKLLEGASKQEL